MTARWVVDVVQPERDLEITWQPISLLFKNNPPEDSDYYAPVVYTHSLLRVFEAINAGEGNKAAGDFYWKAGTFIHHEEKLYAPVEEILEAAGLDASYASAFDDESWDEVIREKMNAGLELVGEDHLPRFVDWIEAWVTPEGGAPHVVGMSNGGLSAFRYAAENPQRTQSIVAFPGFPRSNGDRDALEELTHVPIMLYVGGDDTPWIGPSQETVAEFGALGGLIELTQFPGEGHVIPSTYDGRIVFNDLESFR